MIRNKRQFFIVAATALVWAACADTGPDPRQLFDGDVIATEPLSLNAIKSVYAERPDFVQEQSVSFLSAEEGKFTGADGATITNPRTGQSVDIAIIEGGFHPREIPAAVGDEVQVAVRANGSLLRTVTVPVPEERPPVIIRTDPVKKKIGVPLNVIPVLTFSEPIDPRTVSGSTVRLVRGNDVVTGTVGVIDAGLGIAFFATADLAPNTEYRFEVASTVADLSGSELGQAFALEFTTGTETSGDVVEMIDDTVDVRVGEFEQLGFTLGSSEVALFQTSDSSAVWESRDTSVANVSMFGLVGGVSEGTTWVSVTVGANTDSAFVIVGPPEDGPDGEFEIVPDSVIIAIGDTFQFTLIDSTGTGGTVNWITSDTSIITVDQTGFVTGVGQGTAELAAVKDSLEATAMVVVVESMPPPPPPGGTGFNIFPDSAEIWTGDSLELVVFIDSTPIDPGEVTWTAPDTAVSVVTADGVVIGGNEGTAWVFGTHSAGSDSVLVTVSSIQVAIEPDSVLIEPMDSVQLEFVVLSFATLADSTVTWWTDDSTLVTVQEGLVISNGPPGVARVFGELGGFTASAVVVIGSSAPPPPSGAFLLLPDSAILPVGETLQFELVDSTGSGLPVTWSSSDSTVFTLNQDGLVSGVGAGAGILTVTNGTDSASAPVVVTDAGPPPPPGEPPLELIPDSAVISVGDTFQFNLVDRTGSPLPVLWDTPDSSVITVSQSGLVTGIGAGIATVVAFRDSIEATARVVVVDSTPPPPPPVDELSIVPDSVIIAVGDTVQFGVIDSTGSGGTVDWASADTTVFTVDDNGLVTGTGAGTAELVAEKSGNRASAMVVVTAPSPAKPREGSEARRLGGLEGLGVVSGG